MTLYGCEIWFLVSMEEHRLRISVNRLLKRILGLKRDDVIGG
jgi:hypothetical protein